MPTTEDEGVEEFGMESRPAFENYGCSALVHSYYGCVLSNIFFVFVWGSVPRVPLLCPQVPSPSTMYLVN